MGDASLVYRSPSRRRPGPLACTGRPSWPARGWCSSPRRPVSHAVVLRVFNPVGPGAPEESLPGRVAAELRRALASGAEVRLGSLDAVRDFVDARDVADAVIAAAAGPAPPHAGSEHRQRAGRAGARTGSRSCS